MQTEIQAEVILCPNCNEDVPKTLYCLNCGYPLYKVTMEKKAAEESEDTEDSPESEEMEKISEPVEEEEQVIMQEEEAEEPTVESLEEAQVEFEEVTVDEPETPGEEVELVEAVEVEKIEEAEMITPSIIIEEAVEPVSEEEVSLEESFEAVEEVSIEKEVEEIEEEETEIIEEPVEIEEEAVEETPPEEVVEPAPQFEPAPVIKEVMWNLGKNISLKIRLTNLLRGGEVQLETFTRLFESYAARGERLMNSRNEMLERIRFDLNSMGRALNEAKIGLEELKIRRAIGDVSEEEYQAKSPAFEWDMGQYEDEVGRKKMEKEYLEELTKVMSTEEIAELKDLGETCLKTFEEDELSETVSPELAARIKVTLEEAIAYL